MAGSDRCPRFGRFERTGVRARIAIAVTDEAMGRIDTVAAACGEAGFEHEATLGEAGLLTGTACFRDLPRLQAIPGVLAVELAQRRLRHPRIHHA